MNPQFWWFLSRSSGLVAWAVLTLTLVWGVLLSTKLLSPRVRPPWMLDLHRWLGATSALLVGVHLASLVADSYVRFTLVDLLVPFAADYQPLAVAVGVIGLYLLAAVQASSLAMRRIPTSWWRAVHMSSYALVLVVSLHAALAGTDTFRGFYAIATGVLIAAPLVAIGVRIGARRPPTVARQPAPTRLPPP